jgi:hypothetical protein
VGSAGVAPSEECGPGRALEESPHRHQRHPLSPTDRHTVAGFGRPIGKWKTVHDCHRRWSADGTWEKILQAVQADADAEGRIDWSVVSVDSTVCRAHQHAAGAHHRPARMPGRHSRPVQHRSDPTICVATKRTVPAGTADICGGGRFGTPFPSAGISGPTASGVAATVAGPQVSTGCGMPAGTKSNGRSTGSRCSAR